MMEKSTVKTSRKIYAMKYGINFVGIVLGVYVIGSHFVPGLEPNVFVTAIGAVGVIIGALNIADGMKGHENERPSE